MVPDAAFESTRAITVYAPEREVLKETWSWLERIREEGRGFYSYAWLNTDLSGTAIVDVKRSHPEWQHRVVGETLRLFPATGVRIAAFEPDRATMLEGWGTFAVEPIDDHSTRVILRSRVFRPAGGLYYRLFYHPLIAQLPHFLLERRMLKRIKERTEVAQVPGAAGPS